LHNKNHAYFAGNLLSLSLRFLRDNPLSNFPQGGKVFLAPSHVGEVPIAIGREEGSKHKI